MKTITKDDALWLLRKKIGYGYTQAKMAEDAGVSRPFVSEVLSGRTHPSEKLLALVGVDVVRSVSYVLKDG